MIARNSSRTQSRSILSTLVIKSLKKVRKKLSIYIFSVYRIKIEKSNVLKLPIEIDINNYIYLLVQDGY